MRNILFTKKHFGEYAKYGGTAGLIHVFSVWYFLYRPKDHTSSVLLIGSVLFMFMIMIYALKLTRRSPENYSIRTMIISGQMAVAFGLIVSVIGSFILCCFYLPGFVNIGRVDRFLNKAPGGLSPNHSGAVELIFIMATIENYCAGAFISAIVAYAVKPDQTQDETPAIFEEPAESNIV
jgi:hypothetical protein